MSPSLRILAVSLAAAGAASLAIASCSATTGSVTTADGRSASESSSVAGVDATPATDDAATSDTAEAVEAAPVRAPVELDQAATTPAPAPASTAPPSSESTAGEPTTREPTASEPTASEPADTSASPAETTIPPPDSSVAPADPPIEPVGTNDGPATQRAQERLLQLGFWLESANGDYGVSTTQAVMAFQKYAGLETDGVLGPITAAALTDLTQLPAGRSNTGDLVEIDKTKQLLFIVVGGRTEWVLNASTGSEVPYREPDQNTPDRFEEGDSVTRTGLFRVNREREEGWWEGDLGEIYRPKYFDGGIAIHGAYNVPDYPASHGCVRVSIQAMDWIWADGIVPKGTPVWVHGEIPPRDDAA